MLKGISRSRVSGWDMAESRWPSWRWLPSRGYLLLYGILATVTIATMLLYLRYPEHPFVSDFGPEVATNALAILVTLSFVQRLMDQQERRRRLRGSIGGLRHGARALSRLQEAWATALKGCSRSVSAGGRDAKAELFLNGRTEELMYLDPRATLPDEDIGVLAWLVAKIEAAQETLRSVARQYAGRFDAEYLEALEELIDDSFLELVAELGRRDVTALEWRVRINSARGARARHFSQLLRVIELHNEIAREAAGLRGARPRTRELGITLAADHDLRVFTALPEGWWNRSPRPGTLRDAPAASAPRDRDDP